MRNMTGSFLFIVSSMSVRPWGCLFLITVQFLCFPTPTFSGQHRIPVLDSIARHIDEGRMETARRGLAACAGESYPPEAEAWREVLQARFMSLDGRQHEAYGSLQRLIASLRPNPRMTEVLAEAYLACADICRSMQWIHRLNDWNESVAAIIRTTPMPGHILMRYATNRVYFFSTGLLIEKVDADMRAMDSLIAAAPIKERHLYRPMLALAIQMGVFRNKDRPRIRRMADSIYAHISNPVPRDDSEGRILLWRTLGNFYMDFLAHSDVDRQATRHFSARVDRCFARALGLLDERYPRHTGEKALITNLRGLKHYFIAEYDVAMTFFKESGNKLRRAGMTPASHTVMFGQNASYRQRCIDSIYRGRELVRQRRMMLNEWQEISDVWESWEDMNRDSLGHYRYFYLADPGLYQVYLCHALYRETHDTLMLQMAFDAQERSKSREFVRRTRSIKGHLVPSPPSLTALRRSLASDEAVISISDAFSIPASTFFITVTPDTVLFNMLDLSPRVIQATGIMNGIEEFGRDALHFRDVYHSLWRLVFRDMEPFLKKTNHIRILTSPFTSVFSFDLLIPDTVGARTFGSLRYLRERYRFTYDYSWTVARMRVHGTESPERETPNIAYIPDYTSSPLFRLPFFERQGATLSDRFGFQVRMHGKATLPDFLRHAPDAGILHVGAHGYSNQVSPGDLFIVMDSAQFGVSHRLTPHDLFGIDLKAELAVLSICQGGVSRYDHQGMRHMAYWFNYAGAHTCLYSYWKIDDRSTAWILDRFYGYLSKGVGRYDALRKAQDEYLRNAKSDEEKNPLYWAALTMVGEDGPLPLIERKRGTPWVWLWVGLSLPAFAMAFALYMRRRRKASITSPET
jgi:hypothetical protein